MKRLIEILLLGSILVLGTLIASAEWHKRIRKAQKEYERAREIVEDIVYSFNRELKKGASQLELIAYKVEGSTAKSESILNRVKKVENKISSFQNNIGNISENSSSLLPKIVKLEKKLDNIEEKNQSWEMKIKEVEQKIQKIPIVPEIRSEPVIPIRRDKAMAALTETEITVLEMLSNEGLKTAPEIKDQVQLSREHTARLMKKLYEKGYLERETGKIPFRYSIKKEMKRFLRKAENKPM